MKAVWIFVAVVTFSLIGCANPALKQFQETNNQERRRAESGSIKWSAYYQGVYDRMLRVNGIDDKAFHLNLLSFMIEASQAYESGAISKEQFNKAKRDAQVAMQLKKEGDQRAATQANQEALSNAIKGYQEANKNPPQIRRRPEPCFQDQYGQTVCR